MYMYIYFKCSCLHTTAWLLYIKAHIVFIVLHAEVHRVFEVKGFEILRVKKTCSWDFKFTLICYFKMLKFSCMWCIDEQLVKIANIGAPIEQQSRTCSCYDFSNSLAFNGFTYPWYWWHRNSLFSACWCRALLFVIIYIYISQYTAVYHPHGYMEITKLTTHICFIFILWILSKCRYLDPRYIYR